MESLDWSRKEKLEGGERREEGKREKSDEKGNRLARLRKCSTERRLCGRVCRYSLEKNTQPSNLNRSWRWCGIWFEAVMVQSQRVRFPASMLQLSLSHHPSIHPSAYFTSNKMSAKDVSQNQIKTKSTTTTRSRWKREGKTKATVHELASFYLFFYCYSTHPLYSPLPIALNSTTEEVSHNNKVRIKEGRSSTRSKMKNISSRFWLI